MNNFLSEFTLSHLIGRACASFNEALRHELAPFEMTAAQYVVFSKIASSAPGSVAHLCKEYGYDAGAMTRMLARLEQKQFLRRVRSSEDRRIIFLQLSAQGRAMHAAIEAGAEKVTRRLLHGFSGPELEQFEKLLQKFASNP